MGNAKVYVRVMSVTETDGRVIPKALYWEDGLKYKIDKVTEVKSAASTKAGGCGERYTIWVNGRETYLYFERIATVSGSNTGRWFVERRGA